MNRRRQKTLAVVLAVVAGVGLGVALTRHAETPPAPPVETSASSQEPEPPASAAVWQPLDRTNLGDDFVGSAACAPCHAAEATAHAQSHHARALAPATPEHVVAKLDGASFTTPLGGGTRFAAKDGGFTVTSLNGAGKPETFRLVYAAGVAPLQQYVVATERGKLQTLGVSWDARSRADGGGRLFHVYGPSGIAPADELFFTQPAQNWNHVCADCHSTFVERRYDATADGFETHWRELSVGCEACHGPGAEHVRQARAGAKNVAYASTLSVRLEPSAPWAPSATGSPTPRAPDTTEIEVCAPCHSRRAPLREGFIAGDAFLDAFEPELLEPGRYHADGQVEGEVYEWGSFLQSRMHAAGVRCSDCHEPHSATLRAEGNALCTRCHALATFDAPSHSHHTGEKAPACVDCHLPPTTFMQVDERRDHSIRVPRPDLSVEFGTPNACNRCHVKQTPRWAADTLARWFPAAPRRSHFVAALGRERQGSVDAPSALAELAADATAPAIARATALERLGHFPGKRSVAALRAALANPEPLVVYGAVLGASDLPLAERAPLLLPLLEHPRRLIRVAVGKALAGLPPGELDGKARPLLESAFSEVEQSFALGASQPDALVARSSFEVSRGKVADAEAALNAALRLAPCFAPAHLNLADLARARHDEATALRELHAALECDPKNAFAHHALGLAEVRAGDKLAALADLKKAVALAPSEPRFGYVLAVATADGGDVREAVKILEAALRTHGNDRELLAALAGYLTELDRKEDAANVQAKLTKLLGD